MTVNELIEKLKKFNPDGNMEVGLRFYEVGCFAPITRLAIEEEYDSGNLFVVIHGEDLDGNE